MLVKGSVKAKCRLTRKRSLDRTQPITTDIPCQNCEYNLRGLDQTGLCPECGSPISVSVRSHFEPTASSGRPYVVATLVGLALFTKNSPMLAQTDVAALRLISNVAFFVGFAIHVGVVVGSVKFFRADRKRDVGAMVLALIISAPIAFVLLFSLGMTLLYLY